MIQTKPWRVIAIAPVLLVSLSAACGGAAARAGAAAPAPASSAAGGGSGRVTAADVDFMSAMIGHHAQAIEMARLAPTHGASAAVVRLAARILNAQRDEIATMQRWLRDHDQPVPEPRSSPAPAGHAAHHEHLMPGMLTDAEMRQLDEARDAEFDRLFLTFMIRHHRGAVTMVERLFQSHGAAQDEAVFRIASDIGVDQRTEIARMQKMLADLLFTRNSQ